MATSKEDDYFPKHFAYMIITGSTSPTPADDEVRNDMAPGNATVGSFPGTGENCPNGSAQQNTPRDVADRDINLEKIEVWMSERLKPFNQHAAQITEERYLEVLFLSMHHTSPCMQRDALTSFLRAERTCCEMHSCVCVEKQRFVPSR